MIIHRYIIVSTIFFSSLFAQDKVKWFLSDTTRLRELEKEKYEYILSELETMSKNYNKEIVNNFSKVKSSETFSRALPMTNRQKDLYLSALLSMNNPTQWEADALKQTFTTYVTETVEKVSNRTILFNKVLKSEQPKWIDIVKYLGGYSELVKLDFTENDQSKFKIRTELESFEILDKNTCLAHVKIVGQKDYGLKYYNIQKTQYQYKGTYEIDNIGYMGIYTMVERGAGGTVRFTFSENTHMASTEYLHDYKKEFVSIAKPYHKIMVQMIDDLISEEEFDELESVKEYRSALRIAYQDSVRKVEEEFQRETVRLCENDFDLFKQGIIETLNDEIIDPIGIARMYNNKQKNIRKFNVSMEGKINSEFKKLLEAIKESESYGQIFDNLNETHENIIKIYSPTTYKEMKKEGSLRAPKPSLPIHNDPTTWGSWFSGYPDPIRGKKIERFRKLLIFKAYLAREFHIQYWSNETYYSEEGWFNVKVVVQIPKDNISYSTYLYKIPGLIGDYLIDQWNWETILIEGSKTPLWRYRNLLSKNRTVTLISWSAEYSAALFGRDVTEYHYHGRNCLELYYSKK